MSPFVTYPYPQEISMHSFIQPMLADYIWIGGGTLGLVLVVVVIVLLLRK